MAGGGEGTHRDEEAARRDQAAEQRDRAADQRDHSAELRDDTAAERDAAAAESEQAVGSVVTAETLSHSTAERREAAIDRRRARGDRGAGALERMDAERDRITSLADRGASAREREDARADRLTGAYLRGAGLAELDREVARARQQGHPLSVAVVDVNGLRAVNEAVGHAAGDRMLVTIASTLRTTLHSENLVIRCRDDEFLCVLTGLTLAEATQRIAEAEAAIAAAARRVPR